MLLATPDLQGVAEAPVPLVETPAAPAVLATDAAAHKCPSCPRTFPTPAGLGGHRKHCGKPVAVKRERPGAAVPAAAAVAPAVAGPAVHAAATPAPATPGQREIDPIALGETIKNALTMPMSFFVGQLCEHVFTPPLEPKEREALDAVFDGWAPPAWALPTIVLASIMGPRIWKHEDVQKVWLEWRENRRALERQNAAPVRRREPVRETPAVTPAAAAADTSEPATLSAVRPTPAARNPLPASELARL